MASDTRRRDGRRVGTGVGGDGELTREQREFLDKFSAGMSEAMGEEGGEPEPQGGEDINKA